MAEVTLPGEGTIVEMSMAGRNVSSWFDGVWKVHQRLISADGRELVIRFTAEELRLMSEALARSQSRTTGQTPESRPPELDEIVCRVCGGPHMHYLHFAPAGDDHADA